MLEDLLNRAKSVVVDVEKAVNEFKAVDGSELLSKATWLANQIEAELQAQSEAETPEGPTAPTPENVNTGVQTSSDLSAQ